MAQTDASGGGGRFTLPLILKVLIGFWPLLNFFLKELLNISKNAKNPPHLSWKTKKLWTFENFGKYWFIRIFSNLLSEILDFSTCKIHSNLTDYWNHLKPFLCDRGNQSIKSQKLLGPKCSPNLNKIPLNRREERNMRAISK